MTDSRAVVQSALALLGAGKSAEAEAAVHAGLRREPRHPALNQVMALVLSQRGEPERALYFIDRALAADPSFAEFHLTRGAIKTNTPDLDGAIASFRRTLELQPAHRGARAMLGMALVQQSRYAEALQVLAPVAHDAPANPPVATALARALSDTGRAADAISLLDQALARHPGNADLLSVACMISNYAGVSPARSLELHRAYGRSLLSPPPAPAPRAGDADRPLRIGYLSPDLRAHSVASFLEPILRCHDRERYPAVCFHTGDAADSVTARLRSLASGFHQVGAFGSARLESAVRAEQIDILIELSGHSAGHRLPLLARRLAPIQATFIGYPNTTGVPAIDYRIVDAITDPPGAEALATERLLRLPGCFLCYQPPDESPAPASPNPARPFTFASFNNPAKISPHTVALWASVLAAVPSSRLLLKGKPFIEPEVRARFEAAFSRAGVDKSRIETLPQAPSRFAHLAAYGQADAALDTYPYNGATTTCEALWMGVPVITRAGETHASRVGASLLAAAGLPELVATDDDAFVRCAAALASDRPRLESLHSTLRRSLEASPLCDAATYTRGLESALHSIWRAHASGAHLPPTPPSPGGPPPGARP